VQRILSLATLGVLGGLVWMFLSGGGLNELAQNANTTGVQQGTWNANVPGAAFNWPGATPATSAPGQATQSGYAPAIATGGPTAPPAQFGPTIKIASFNIQVFGQKKSENPAVMTTLAAIIRQFDLVAIQEIRSSEPAFLPNFLRLVNAQGARYDFVIGPPLGNSTQTERLAYVFNTDRIYCDPTRAYTISDPDNLIAREPFVATFSTRSSTVSEDVAFSFTLINVHTTPDPVSILRGELDALAEVYRVVRRAGGNEDDVIMLGDFNADDRNLGRLGQIPEVLPLIRGVFTNTKQTALYDNIIVHAPSTTEYRGKSNVFDLVRVANLRQDEAEAVSDHFPVWAEFSVYERDQYGRVASRSGTAAR
jgi:deoxyribonuclease-1-like protein